MELTHFDKSGNAVMVDVTEKSQTKRQAVAEGYVNITREIFVRIANGTLSKGDVLSVAQIAGIMGAKKTSELIPLCHNILIEKVKVNLSLDEENSRVRIEALAACDGKTGVEMEALTAVSISALTVYDMVKAVDKNMTITGIRLLEKIGGKSGQYKVEE